MGWLRTFFGFSPTAREEGQPQPEQNVPLDEVDQQEQETARKVGEIGEEKARDLGREIQIDVAGSMRLNVGNGGECYWNAYSLMEDREKDRYCLGFAATSDRVFARHAWIKRGEIYLDNTRQKNGQPANFYYLVHELTLDQVDEFYHERQINPAKAHYPIEISLAGELETPRPPQGTP